MIKTIAAAAGIGIVGFLAYKMRGTIKGIVDVPGKVLGGVEEVIEEVYTPSSVQSIILDYYSAHAMDYQSMKNIIDGKAAGLTPASIAQFLPDPLTVKVFIAAMMQHSYKIDLDTVFAHFGISIPYPNDFIYKHPNCTNAWSNVVGEFEQITAYATENDLWYEEVTL